MDKLIEPIVFHVEDDPDWQDLIEHIVSNNLPGLRYKLINLPIDEALSEIKNSGTPSISVFDLRLSEFEDEYETLLKILANLRTLQRNGTELFILTGYLPSAIVPFLINQGISSHQIYQKELFDQNRREFITALSTASKRLRHGFKPKVSTPYRIVHLSDIHIGQEKSSYLFHQDIRNELLSDLKKLREERGDAHVLIITGDTAFSGTATEYDEARIWLRLACEAAGCSTEAVFLIPGNHDISRDKISPLVELLHKNIRSSKEDELIQKLSIFERDLIAAEQLLVKLQNYRDFARNYRSNFESYQKAFWITDITHFGSPIFRLVGLNTVLISDKEDAVGNMVLPQSQYIFPRENDVEYIVLMHHPTEWLRNAHTVRPYLENRAKIILMGHEHELRVSHLKNMAGSEQLIIYAGATNPPMDDTDYAFRYNWLEIEIQTSGDLRELNVSLWPRVWTLATRFVPDYNALQGDKFRNFHLPLSSALNNQEVGLTTRVDR